MLLESDYAVANLVPDPQSHILLTTTQERPMYVALLAMGWGLGTNLGPVIGGAFLCDMSYDCLRREATCSLLPPEGKMNRQAPTQTVLLRGDG